VTIGTTSIPRRIAQWLLAKGIVDDRTREGTTFLTQIERGTTMELRKTTPIPGEDARYEVWFMKDDFLGWVYRKGTQWFIQELGSTTRHAAATKLQRISR
jgi:hypothetical protein